MRIPPFLTSLALTITAATFAEAQTTDMCSVTGTLTGTFTEIAVPGATTTSVSGINNMGQIVGSFSDATGNFASFILDRGIFSLLNGPDDVSLFPSAINNAGVVVGQFFDDGYHGFIWDRSTLTQLDVPGASATSALGINDRGVVTGVYLTPGGEDGIEHGFIYDHGQYTTVDYPGAGGTTVLDIDNTGLVLGGAFVAPNVVSFLYKDGGFTELPQCGSGLFLRSYTRPGQIVGFVRTGLNLTQGAEVTGRGLLTLQYPGSEFTSVVGGTSSGHLVGLYQDAVNVHSFLFTPEH